MAKRPTSVRVVCWLLINLGAISLVPSILFSNYSNLNGMATSLMAGNPMPISLEYLFDFGGTIIALACGIAMRKGKNWGRILIVTWFFFACMFGFLIWVMASLSSLFALGPILALALFAALAVSLPRPNVNEYFSPWSFQNDLREIISIISYVLAGLILFAACELMFAKMEPSNVKFIMIGAFVSFALVPLLVGFWLSTFRKWLYFTGIVLLLVAGSSMIRMIWRIVVLPEFALYLRSPSSPDLFTDYFTGIVCILVMSLAGGFFVWSGRVVGGRPSAGSNRLLTHILAEKGTFFLLRFAGFSGFCEDMD
jgi:hypothetical protein